MSDSYSVLKRRYHLLENTLIVANMKIFEANNTIDKALEVYKGLDNAMTPCSSVVDLLKLIQKCLAGEPTK